ncbi:sensor domain-containing diguanylate cyclase [Desulfoluna spongiiphila]|uniref:PAS domain S-box-containing protein/diguanylate cyclase (GGDEF) domain-containing protein n=1 Tax=Desulfoluna spongiiphila TaxID=419481 RepID=A0A1G5AQI8_9BACT|nr:sensor domain-containing diguanylate cyclase [Desulfoluna spongiiphila]SCX80141.1 PAS domain S-box-containing protein/diguanylate cyclase (GGDEF) domain-containing protein [Desulfoluna spongiiphila]VVS91940.1 nucleotide cyclase [Desulfoluna spongiiphila]
MDIKTAFPKIVDNIHDGLYIVDKNRAITFWNKAAERITGYAAGEVLGKKCSENILTHLDGKGNKLCTGRCPLEKTMADKKMREADIFLHHKNGHRIPVSVRVSTLNDTAGNVIGGIELFTDISYQTLTEQRIKELEKLALLDILTQLANRTGIIRALQGDLEEHKRYGVPFGILFMDIDHFKVVNDTFGHDAGDKVLKVIADTFTANSRAFDLYGRWGGEEFIGIIRNITAEALESLGNRLRTLIENTFCLHEGIPLKVTISMGATIVRRGDTIDTLIKRADTLLYESKASGRNRTSFR